MKALIIEGSTRSNAGTQAYIDTLKKHNTEFEFEQISLREEALPHFVDHRIDGDWTHAQPVLPLLQKMLSADLIIIASPVYWFSVSHLTKNFLDFWTYFMRAGLTPERFFLEGKKVMSLMVASHKEGSEWAFGSLKSSVEFVHGHMVHEFLGITDRAGIPETSDLARAANISLKDLLT